VRLSRRRLLQGIGAAALFPAGLPLANKAVFAAARSSLQLVARIPASACGMDPGLADNAVQLARGLTNFNGIIDGGGRTYKFTQAGGSDASPGPLFLAPAKGVRGLSNMTLDFSACIPDWYLLHIDGLWPTAPIMLSANAAALSLTVTVTDAT